jgi:hypothetical protein
MRPFSSTGLRGGLLWHSLLFVLGSLARLLPSARSLTYDPVTDRVMQIILSNTEFGP